MGRYETIEAVIRMKSFCENNNEWSVEQLREQYRNEELPAMKLKIHRIIVEEACVLVEDAIRYRLEKSKVESTLKYFCVCLDAMKYHLDWRKAKEDLGIHDIWREIAKITSEKRANITELMGKCREMITEEDLKQICDHYKLNKDWKKAVSDNWHRVIVGKAAKLALTVIRNGGTEEEVRQALLYYTVCLDVNKYMLDYKKYKQENGIVELSEKYNVKTN